MGFGHYAWAWVVAVVAILLAALYFRARRMIGRQRYSPRRVRARAVLLALVTVFLVVIYARRAYPAGVYGALAAGFVIGALVAGFAVRFTRMGRHADEVWYTPNLYLGGGLLVVLVGRYVYEYFIVYPQIQHRMALAARGTREFSALPHPFLYGTLFLVLGYYVVYYAGLIYRVRRLAAEMPDEGPE